MPRGNGTGPVGMGPLTGRSAGFCTGFRTPGYMNSGFGQRLGLGRGRGFRRMFWLAGLRACCPDADTLLTDGQIAGAERKGTYSAERR